LFFLARGSVEPTGVDISGRQGWKEVRDKDHVEVGKSLRIMSRSGKSSGKVRGRSDKDG
jgi:hypothetical protein